MPCLGMPLHLNEWHDLILQRQGVPCLYKTLKNLVKNQDLNQEQRLTRRAEARQCHYQIYL
jgi:hypothetical protein